MNIQTPVVGKDVSEAVFGQEYNEGIIIWRMLEQEHVRKKLDQK